MLFVFLVLFGVPFVLIGLGLLVWVGRSWRRYLSARAWQPVPAAVRDVEFQRHPGDDTDTYSVAATYEYSFEGRQFTGQRVDIMGGSSSNYRLHRARYERLLEHKENGQPVEVWVNPDRPSEAVIYREATAWMYAMVPFGLVFFAAGVGVSALGLHLWRKQRQLTHIAVHDANRVWHCREDWAAGCVRAGTTSEMLVAWGLGIGLAAFVSIFVIMMGSEGAPVFAWACIGVFLLIALVMLLRALLLTARHLLHGPPILHLQEVPIVPGRTVNAAMRTHKPLRSDRWTVRLKCFLPQTDSDSSRRTIEGVRDLQQRLEQATGQTNRGVSVSSLRGFCAFSRELSPAGEPASDRTGRTMLPLAITVPDGVPGSSLDASLSVTWALEVHARSFPLSFRATFDLPVFYAEEHEIERPAGEA
ncbi:MAG: DUF3592 domain-containing protein [Candidatus Brocadiia bacterium]